MKKLSKILLVAFAMMIMAMPFAAAADYAQYQGPWPFDSNGEYIGVNSATSASGYVYDGWSTAFFNYAKDSSGNVFYYDDYGYYDRNFAEFGPSNWETIVITKDSIPALQPIVMIADWSISEIDYIWKDQNDNFWMSIAKGSNVIHIDSEKCVYDSSFNMLTYDESQQLANAMEADAANGILMYTPDMMISNLQSAEIPAPGGGSMSIVVGVVVVVLVIACGAYFMRGRKKNTATAGAENMNADYGQQQNTDTKSNTERAAEAAAKAANMANDMASKAADAAKTTAFMAKEKANAFSKAYKEAQERQRATNKTVCPNCGAQNDAGSKFCQNCGAKISEDQNNASV